MKRVKLLSLCIAAVGLLLCQTKSAQALIVTNSPFGTDRTDTYLGYSAGWGGTYVIYSDLDNGGCAANYVGGTSLSDDVVINGGSGIDFITLVRSGWPNSVCGTDLIVASYNGHWVTAYGNAGVDFMIGGAGDDDWLLGGDGNDHMWNYSPLAFTSGDNGDDNMSNYASGSSDVISGGSGNDCVRDWSGAASYFDCGDGYDTVIPAAPVNMVNCERVANTCL